MTKIKVFFNNKSDISGEFDCYWNAFVKDCDFLIHKKANV